MPSVVVIVNPTAGGGSAARAFEQLHPQLCGWAPGCRVRFTGGRGDATALAETARREQADIVVVAGGDGTFHEVVNGLLGADDGATPDLVCLPLGTGCDLARSLRLPGSTDALRTPLSSYQRLRLDIGVAELSGLRRHDAGIRVHFVNDANAGLGSSVASRVGQSTLLRCLGAAAYGLAAISGIIRGARIDLAWESPQSSGHAAFLNVSICNGPSFGGGIRPVRRHATTTGRSIWR